MEPDAEIRRSGSAFVDPNTGWHGTPSMANSPGTTVNVWRYPVRSRTCNWEFRKRSTTPTVPLGRCVMDVPWPAPTNGYRGRPGSRSMGSIDLRAGRRIPPGVRNVRHPTREELGRAAGREQEGAYR